MRILKPSKNLKSFKSNKISTNESDGVSENEKSKVGLELVNKKLERLSEGLDINETKIELTPEQPQDECEAQSSKDYLVLYNKAINLLSIREYSELELETKLSIKSENRDLILVLIDELIDKNYLSNDRFTEIYVRSRQKKGFGPTKIRIELNGKGIKNSMIELYLNESSAVWYDSAQNQYTKKYGEDPISDYNSWTKRARFMQSRGFTMEHIHSTLPPVESD